MTCLKHKLQYVGECECSLQERMNKHRYTIIRQKAVFVAKHFRNEEHSLSDCSIQIIKHCESIGKRAYREKRFQKDDEALYYLPIGY